MTPPFEFKRSESLTLGVELELQLLSKRDFDLTRAASDLVSNLSESAFGDIKLEITESMIEVSTTARADVAGISEDLKGLRDILIQQCARNNVVVCGGGTHPFHSWPQRRICPSERFDAFYNRYGYLAKQFTVFGQHIHVGCRSADEAIWLTQALGAYVPFFIALSASSPFVDRTDTFFQSARLNAVSAFPLSGQCPPLTDWRAFLDHYDFLQQCGIVGSIKDLYWDIRPKPEFGTVEIRVCDTPLTVERATALAALAQCITRFLLRTRPVLHPESMLFVARYNKFQACRYGFDAQISDPDRRRQYPLREALGELFDSIAEDARELKCSAWIDQLRATVLTGQSDAAWLRERFDKQGNLNDVSRDAASRFAGDERSVRNEGSR